MSQLQLADELTNDAILYALAASIAFLTAVLIFDPKLRKSAIGKALLTLDIGLAGLEAPSVLHRYFGLQITDLWFSWYYLGSVLVVGTSVWWRTWLMVATQLRGRRKRQAPPPGDPLPAPIHEPQPE